MQPIHDVDVVVLMATTIASKRRPAELLDLVAGAAMIQGFVIYPDKLGEAIARLSYFGLICAAEDNFTLTPAAQKIMAELPRKGDMEEHLAFIREQLVTYYPREEHAAIELKMDRLSAAVLDYKELSKVKVKNLALPKPKADRFFKQDGRWRCAPAGKSSTAGASSGAKPRPSTRKPSKAKK